MSNYASELARHWRLDPEVIFLNHGSFGACPSVVLEEQSRLRDELEREPLTFLDRELYGRLGIAREALATFVGAGADDIAFVTNATTGVNAVLRSLKFEAGDELLLSNHEYNACRNVIYYIAERWGAKPVVFDIPFPLTGDDDVVEAMLRKVTPRTRLLLIDHITSPTALVLPVKHMVDEMQARGIDTLVDGAHAPGMLPLDLTTLGAAYYTGNCHKWLCTPKGSAFLHVRPDRKRLIKPTVISHGYNMQVPDEKRFRVEFDWTGTADPSPWLCIPRAIELLSSFYPDGMAGHMRHNRELSISARRYLMQRFDVSAPCPENMLGSMASLPMPDNVLGSPEGMPWKDWMFEALYRRFNIEVIVLPWPATPRRILRICAQAYNSMRQYEILADAVTELLAEEGHK